MLLARPYKYLLYKLGDNNNNVGDRWPRAFTIRHCRPPRSAAVTAKDEILED